MDVAIDPGSQKLVHAATAPRGRDYRCPTCHAPVHLRRGSYREPHFAHDPGQGRPECDDYHVSESWLGPVAQEPVAPPPVNILPRQRLTLWLNVQPATGRTPAGWNLEVLVPRSPGRAGRLTFDGGADGLRVELSCAKLNAGAVSCLADPDAGSFRVFAVSRDVDRLFAQAMQDRLSGLDPQRANVFAAGRGNRQERAPVLNRGDSYYLVYRSDRLAEVPPAITTVRLSNQKAWSCVLVTLPTVADPALDAWFERNTSLSIMPAKQQWGIAAPAFHAMDSTARMVVNAGADIVLAVHPGDRGGGQPTLHAVAGAEAEALTLRPHEWNLVTISGVLPTQPLALRVNEHALPEVIARSFVRTSPQVVLQLGADAVAAHTPEAAVGLERVRAGLADLKAVFVPPGFEGQLRFRRLGEVDWTQLALPAAGSTQAGVPLAQDLGAWSDVLRDRRYDVVVDFGPFGYWWSGGQEPVAEPTALSSHTRAHLAWLLQAAGRPAAALGADERIASTIGSLVPPRWLIAHHRLACARIAREGGRR